MLLELSDVSLWFGADPSQTSEPPNQVLHSVSMCVAKGTTTALVGESGSGKTVTALTILRLLEETTSVRTAGSIRLDGEELLNLPLAAFRQIRGNRIAMIFQEPMTSLNPVYSVGNQLVEPLMLHGGMSRHEAEKEAVQLLARTNIDNPEERLRAFPHQLSGGQRQRVMIAMALACRPNLLIADEPTTALDVTVQAQIIELIKNLQDDFGMSVLLITHDLTLVKKISNTAYIMKKGCVVESGEVARMFTDPRHPYTRHLLESIPSGFTEPRDAGPLLLRTTDLTCRFELPGGWVHPFKRNKKIVNALIGVDIELHEGTTCGIIGESGSGKTTLAMALLKLTRSTGEILFRKTNLQTLSAGKMRSVRCDIQIVFQDPYSSLSPRLTVFQIVEEGLRIHQPRLSADERTNLVAKALEDVGLAPSLGNRYPHEFSGGQRQRIAIARAIVLQPRLLILDEPTSALDVTIQAQIIDLLKDLQRRYAMTYLFISHDLRVVRAIADHIAVMQHGRIVESGSARQLFTNPRQPYTRQLFQAALG